jgi:hypothetical protein
MTNSGFVQAELTRKIELTETEMGLISLAVELMARSSHGIAGFRLSEYDEKSLHLLAERVDRW